MDSYRDGQTDFAFTHVPVTPDWEEVVVPLRDLYPNHQDLRTLKQFAITIDTADPPNGAVYIDDVKLTARRRNIQLSPDPLLAEAIPD